MSEKKLIDFLRQAQKLKLNLEAIGRELVKAGWVIKDVEDALESVKPFRAPKAPGAGARLKPEVRPKVSEESSDAEKNAIEHIKKLRTSGMTNDQIKKAFIEKGWREDIIDNLLEKAEE